MSDQLQVLKRFEREMTILKAQRPAHCPVLWEETEGAALAELIGGGILDEMIKERVSLTGSL
ncbi:MAG: hypothetical protein R3C11_28780 [Planctomycetaceae bacterium]